MPTTTRSRIAYVSAVVCCGVLAGLVGLATTFTLHELQHLTFGYHSGSLLLGVSDAPWQRRLAGPVVGGVVAALCWWALRRRRRIVSLTEEVRAGERIDTVGQSADAVVQLIVVGTGGSLGREGAPRQLAAVAATRVTRLLRIEDEQRQVLWASAAGAGLAAVYNVPLGGALFTVQVLLRSWRPATVITALATSVIAVTTTWPVEHGAPTFDWPVTHPDWGSALFAVLVAPLAVAIGWAFEALTGRVDPSTRRGWRIVPQVAAAGLLTGTAALYLPALPGNGKSLVTTAFSPSVTLATMGVAVILKPLLTAAYLRAGANGGLLTPAFATGVSAGAFVALGITALGGTDSVPAFGLTGGAAVLAITQDAPLFAAVFAWELVRPPLGGLLVLLLAALAAHVLARSIRRRASADRTDDPPHRPDPGRCRRPR